jgi:hypothetical protein
VRSIGILSKKRIAFPMTALLIACAVISAIIYLAIFTVPFPLSQLYNTIPPVDYSKLTGYSWGSLWLYIVGISILFALYIAAIRLTMPSSQPCDEKRLALPPTFPEAAGADDAELTVESAGPQGDMSGDRQPAIHAPIPLAEPYLHEKHGIDGRLVIAISACLATISIFSYPLTAIDLFIYAIRTRGWGLYNLQPLSTPPEALPTSDPWLGLAGEWIDAASPYGPLWEGLSLGAFFLSNGDFLAHLFALKVIGLLAYLGCTWLVFIILSQLRPRWAVAGTIAFAWSPLVLFEAVQNAHNDIVMAVFLLAAIWVFVQADKRGDGLLASLLALLFCLLLALSILVKFVTIIVAPFFLLALAMRHTTWSRRLIALALYGSVLLLLVIVAMLPFWPGLENWAVPVAGRQAGRSLLALLVLGLRDQLGTNTAFNVSRTLITLAFLCIYLFILWRSFLKLRDDRQRSAFISTTCSAAYFALFWYVLLAAPVFHAWYLLWFLPLAALLLPDKGPLIIAIVFSVTALLVIPYFETVRVWYPALLRSHFIGHLIGVPLLIMPPLLVLLWSIRPGRGSEV